MSTEDKMKSGWNDLVQLTIMQTEALAELLKECNSVQQVSSLITAYSSFLKDNEPVLKMCLMAETLSLFKHDKSVLTGASKEDIDKNNMHIVKCVLTKHVTLMKAMNKEEDTFTLEQILKELGLESE